MTRLILVGILLLLSLAFVLQNQEQEVTLRYFFGLLEASTPIYKPVMAGFVVGSWFPPSYSALLGAQPYSATP